MSTEDPDVLIIGCGPVGMILAGLLATAGIGVRALEREPELGRRPRARHIDAEAMRVLQTIGVAEATEQTMRPLGGFRLVDAGGRTLLEQPGDNTRPGEQGWIPDYQMFQPLLLQILLDHLRADDGAEVRTGHEAVALEQLEDHVLVTTLDRATGTVERITARYVVGCDGADSNVRDMIGAPFRALGPDHPYLVIDAMPLRPDFELPEPTHSLNVCDPARPHYVSPGSDSVPIRLEFMVMPGDDPAELVSAQGISRLTARYIEDGDVRFDRAAVYVFHSLLVDDWRIGRVLLAGDAAHVQPPFMGQGLCSGFRDASNLAWKLAMVCRGDAGEELLDSYQAERRPHARDWISEANRIGAIVMTTDAAEAAARDERIRGGNFRDLRPITPTLGPGLHGGAGPPAGTLAPQPFLADGRRLDELVGSRFLVTASADRWAGVSEDVRRAVTASPDVILVGEEAAALLAHYGTAGVVVRPDRYVLGVADESDGLERVIARIPSFARSAPSVGSQARYAVEVENVEHSPPQREREGTYVKRTQPVSDITTTWEEIPASDVNIVVFVARPESARRTPALVVIPENPGITEWRQQETVRIASALRWTVVVMSPYSRIGGEPPAGPFATQDERRRAAFLAMPDQQVAQDLARTVTWIRAREYTNERLPALLGFCTGGGQALYSVCTRAGLFACVVSIYGNLVLAGEFTEDRQPLDRLPLVAGLDCPLQFHVGTRDFAISPEHVDQLEAELLRTYKTYELYRYPGANHIFADATHPNYDANAAGQLWERTYDFLVRHADHADSTGGTSSGAVALRKGEYENR